MIDKYLKETLKGKISFADFHYWSGLSNLESSSIWMKNIEKITKHKNPPKENIYWKNKVEKSWTGHSDKHAYYKNLVNKI